MGVISEGDGRVHGGGDDYNLSHMGKRRLEREVGVIRNVVVGEDIVRESRKAVDEAEKNIVMVE